MFITIKNKQKQSKIMCRQLYYCVKVKHTQLIGNIIKIDLHFICMHFVSQSKKHGRMCCILYLIGEFHRNKDQFCGATFVMPRRHVVKP